MIPHLLAAFLLAQTWTPGGHLAVDGGVTLINAGACVTLPSGCTECGDGATGAQFSGPVGAPFVVAADVDAGCVGLGGTQECSWAAAVAAGGGLSGTAAASDIAYYNGASSLTGTANLQSDSFGDVLSAGYLQSTKNLGANPSTNYEVWLAGDRLSAYIGSTKYQIENTAAGGGLLLYAAGQVELEGAASGIQADQAVVFEGTGGTPSTGQLEIAGDGIYAPAALDLNAGTGAFGGYEVDLGANAASHIVSLGTASGNPALSTTNGDLDLESHSGVIDIANGARYVKVVGANSTGNPEIYVNGGALALGDANGVAVTLTSGTDYLTVTGGTGVTLATSGGNFAITAAGGQTNVQNVAIFGSEVQASQAGNLTVAGYSGYGAILNAGTAWTYIHDDTCVMSSAASCTFTNATVTATSYIDCEAENAHSTWFDGWSISGTTVTVYAHDVNSSTWKCLEMNP